MLPAARGKVTCGEEKGLLAQRRKVAYGKVRVCRDKDNMIIRGRVYVG
ncbi:MAG: hypothetical protein E6583_00895 [Clostridium sp.]|nr:hypothetical protein [Clostridium sp.]